MLDDDASTHRALLSTRLEQITAELEKRDFSDVPTAKLLELELKTRAELAREFAEFRVRSEEELAKEKPITILVNGAHLP